MAQRPEPYQDLVAVKTYDFLASLQLIAADRGTSMAGLALAWLLADDRVKQVVVGPSSPAQLAPVTEATEHPLTDGERIAIEEAFSQ
jgi:aryl-alcohol dehydrogenase-like predicted oxidoreductase